MATANNMRIERQGLYTEPTSRRYPTVRGGTCEFCGVMDHNIDAHNQYKLCEHYRGMQLSCSYCPAEKDPDDVIKHSVMKVFDKPGEPGTLVVVCDHYDCEKKHQDRFRVNS